jgi:hypothetical protein
MTETERSIRDTIKRVFGEVFDRMTTPTEILDIEQYEHVYVVTIMPLTIDPRPLCERLAKALYREGIAAGITWGTSLQQDFVGKTRVETVTVTVL